MKKALAVAVVAFLSVQGSSALAASDTFTPAKSPELLKDMVLYPGAFRLTDAKEKAAVDASVAKLFNAVKIKCTTIEDIFWGSKIDRNKIAAGFELEAKKLKYNYSVVQKLKTGSIIKISANNQDVYGLWNFTKKTTMFSLCK
ncbi:hypothetical protein [Deinococcus cellulosilyticus]|uniref:Uncharacterized protein n=1 Tax=Deinococcus cellulosilyticus (strain DSM 18568 / NBRC 106333 / KACC 11606 / 5516J-15) TaxID=1223518 RepID=A0A511N2G9_DEIC1|nr:hypothetical protein [Deinococcus cellulosilyticus]GEM47045.1 hypothetical protein DC3_26800 [Deinococcus cellulosilyticus NBRC 106333 = KACC 11606]